MENKNNMPNAKIQAKFQYKEDRLIIGIDHIEGQAFPNQFKHIRIGDTVYDVMGNSFLTKGSIDLMINEKSENIQNGSEVFVY